MLPLRHDRRSNSNSRNTRFNLTTNNHHVRKLPLIGTRTRYTRFLIALGLFTVIIYLLRNSRKEIRKRLISRDFRIIRDYERNLPQNTIYRPNRMVKFSNEVWGLGFNNQLNNRLVLSHLAYLSKRAYVFQDVMFGDTWDGSPWYPLNTFISGPTAGGTFPRGIMAPRAISSDTWERHCPYNDRKFLNVTELNIEMGIEGDRSNGTRILEVWGRRLLDLPDTCVEIRYDSKHIIDFYFFGSPESLSLWPTFSTSPVVSGHKWSATVLSAVERNTQLIAGQSHHRHQHRNLDNVLALHLRRGDFESHCTHMTKYASGYNSWNLLPELPDRYQPPDTPSLEDPRDIAEFMRHCWPSIEDIVRRAHQVKIEHEEFSELPRLDSVYVLTNGDKKWAADLKKALMHSSSGWKSVTTSRDLSLREGPEKLAAQTIDMAIASEVGGLIGNGFSTLTANVVMFRLLDGKSPQTCRTW